MIFNFWIIKTRMRYFSLFSGSWFLQLFIPACFPCWYLSALTPALTPAGGLLGRCSWLVLLLPCTSQCDSVLRLPFPWPGRRVFILPISSLATPLLPTPCPSSHCPLSLFPLVSVATHWDQCSYHCSSHFHCPPPTPPRLCSSQSSTRLISPRIPEKLLVFLSVLLKNLPWVRLNSCFRWKLVPDFLRSVTATTCLPSLTPLLVPGSALFDWAHLHLLPLHLCFHPSGACQHSMLLMVLFFRVQLKTSVLCGVLVMAQQKQIWLESLRTQIQSLVSLSGLRNWCCCELGCRSQTQFASGIAVAVVWAGGYSSNLTPSLGSSIRYGCSPKKTK